MAAEAMLARRGHGFGAQGELVPHAWLTVVKRGSAVIVDVTRIARLG
jgi:hypothetical protein